MHVCVCVSVPACTISNSSDKNPKIWTNLVACGALLSSQELVLDSIVLGSGQSLMKT